MKTVKTADLGVFSVTAIQDGLDLKMFIEANFDSGNTDAPGEEVDVNDMRKLVDWLRWEVFHETGVRVVPAVTSMKEVELDKQQKEFKEWKEVEQLELPLGRKVEAKEGMPSFDERSAVSSSRTVLKQITEIPNLGPDVQMTSKPVDGAKKIKVRSGGTS